MLVIFSMFLIDLRRPSISRRVAKLAALGGAVLYYMSAIRIGSLCFQAGERFAIVAQW